MKINKECCKFSILKRIKKIRHKVENPLIWKMLSGLEQIIMGGRYRIIVIDRIAQIVGLYHLSPYRPKGTIYSFESWLERSIPSEMEGSCIKKTIKEHLSYQKTPNSIDNEINSNFIECNRSLQEMKYHLCLLKNVRVVNEKGTMISYDNKVYTEFSFENEDFTETSDVFKSYISKPKIKKECLATICSNAHSNTFHWTFDVLPRLKLLEDIIEDIDHLIVPEKLNQFQLDSLKHLQISPTKLLQIKNGDHFICENLFVTSFPRKKGYVPRWACEFLRKSFIPKDIGLPHRLIYITRKDAFFRRITNEEEIEDYLISLGFEIIQMSNFSFMEQVKIFAESKVVVGPHGAGLTNIVFCQNAKILEIFSPSYAPTMYWMISNNVGNDYYYILGEDLPGNTHPEWKDFKVDINQFKQILENILVCNDSSH